MGLSDDILLKSTTWIYTFIKWNSDYFFMCATAHIVGYFRHAINNDVAFN